MHELPASKKIGRLKVPTRFGSNGIISEWLSKLLGGYIVCVHKVKKFKPYIMHLQFGRNKGLMVPSLSKRDLDHNKHSRTPLSWDTRVSSPNGLNGRGIVSIIVI